MKEADVLEVYKLSNYKIGKVRLGFKRYLYPVVDWDDPLICLQGARGVGKTTLLLQKIKESADRKTTLYVSLDSIWLDLREVYELVRYHWEHGGTRVVLDEVHYLKGWQKLIKNLADDFPEMKFAYTGSSLLKIKAGGGDLSRRQREFYLNGLSFREYLELEGVLKREAIALEDLLARHEEISEEITAAIKVLPQWERYFKEGYYPFYRDVPSGYAQRLVQTVNQVLESDWPSVEEVSIATIRRARKMLRILARRPPQTPKMNELYDELETDRKQGLKILNALVDARLLIFFSSDRESLKTLSSPDKVFCENPNLAYALATDANVGTARECWIVNQLKVGHEALYPKKGDIEIDGKYLLEVGGKSKGFDQIADMPNSFVVNDGVEVGVGNKIPLWLFGFLY